jgi:trigger factor
MDAQAKIIGEDGWSRTIEIRVPAKDVDAAMEAATKRYGQNADVPGFRKGKAPKEMLMERFGAEIRQEAMEDVVPRALEAGIRQLEISPIGHPRLSEMKFEPGDDMLLVAELEIRPTVEISGYKGLKLERKVYEVTDRDIDMAVDRMRDKGAKLVEVQRAAQTGDVVVVDLQKIHDKLNKVKKDKFENVKLELLESRGRPEFVKAITGMTIGEGKEIEISYPPDEPDEDLAGNTVLFRAWLKSVSEKELPIADDAFAKSMSGMNTIAELRDRLRESIQRNADGEAMKDMGRQARQQVVEANQFDVPKGIMNDYIEGVTQQLKESNPGVTEEAVRKQFEPAAVEQFRWDYAVSEIAKKENLAISDQEVKDVQATWPADAPDRPSEDRIRDSLLENKVYEFIVSQAEVSEVPRVLNPQIVTPGGGGA